MTTRSSPPTIWFTDSGASLRVEPGVITSITHPVTRYRLEHHQKKHPEHDQREMTSVAERYATWICSCGVVFRTEEVDESVLADYRQALEGAVQAEVEARRQERIAADKRMEARMIIACLEEGL